MSAILRFVVVPTLWAVLTATAVAATSPKEILYVTERQSGTISLLAYDVNPETAVAKPIGEPMFVGASNIDPLTIGDKNFVYVWSATDVWLYPTAPSGAPAAKYTQHLTFNFPHPVASFLVDPDGKFAYAGLIWWDSETQTNYAAIYLYTVDPSTGKLTDTQDAVATYSNAYTFFRSFSFGLSGKRFYVSAFDDGPNTCEPESDYYKVDQNTGDLGALRNLVTASLDCGGSGETVANDQLTGVGSTCCGPGSGYLQITRISTGKQITCQASDLNFCGDDAGDIVFDPSSQNVVFPDTDVKETFIGHLVFASSQLTQSPSMIRGNPYIYFSPDSQVLYALYDETVGINIFQSATGQLLATTSLPVKGKVTIATTTTE